jgi:hypothetical protein
MSHDAIGFITSVSGDEALDDVVGRMLKRLLHPVTRSLALVM